MYFVPTNCLAYWTTSSRSISSLVKAGLDSDRVRLELVSERLRADAVSVRALASSTEEFPERLDFGGGGGGGKDLLLLRVRVRVETVAEAETLRSDR